MLFFAGVTGFDCGGEFILKIIKFVMILLDLVLFIVPMILIVMVSIDFVKNVIAHDEGAMKKNMQLIIKRFIMCVALFLVDPIVHFTINLLGNVAGMDYAQCVIIATTEEDLSQYKLDLFPDANEPSTTPDIKKPTDPGFVPSSGGSGSNSSGGGNNSTSSEKVNTTFFIGDSRFVGMQSVVDDESDKIDFIAKTSQGYSWLQGNALPTLDGKIKSGKKYNIVINLGVNDLGNIASYLKLYNSMASNSKYKNCNIIVVSVNPVDDSLVSNHGYTVKDSEVQAFNKQLKSGLNSSIKYCDTYSKIKNSFVTNGDGLHYNNSTYQKIYKEIKNCL